ncbi:hypothetical protein B0J18DRAFT_414651 [Chaetomium sp. MPI-SDFR-AT-0129]|nr:hypothetical protein B0J18DRAFT_414651 [Chaetomium sp. MPI-SDFR-AT-0129]
MPHLYEIAVITATFLSSTVCEVAAHGVFIPSGRSLHQAAFRPITGGFLDPRIHALVARQVETCTIPQPWVPCPDGLSCCPAKYPKCVSILPPYFFSFSSLPSMDLIMETLTELGNSVAMATAVRNQQAVLGTGFAARTQHKRVTRAFVLARTRRAAERGHATQGFSARLHLEAPRHVASLTRSPATMVIVWKPPLIILYIRVLTGNARLRIRLNVWYRRPLPVEKYQYYDEQFYVHSNDLCSPFVDGAFHQALDEVLNEVLNELLN